jgi:hypothetical protein
VVGRPAALAALPEGYRPLFDRATAVFEADGRVRAMWLHGALARGAADAASDLDISVAIADDGFDGFAASWRDWLAAITPTLTARPLAAGSFYALTPSCERFDVIAEPVGKLPATSLTRRLVVFDRDGLDKLIPVPADPPPDPAVLTYLIEETLRQAANFPAVLVRDDWLLGVVAVQQVQMFLYQLFAESNKAGAADRPEAVELQADRRPASGPVGPAGGRAVSGLGAGGTRGDVRGVLSRGPADRRPQRHRMAVPPGTSRPGLPA